MKECFKFSLCVMIVCLSFISCKKEGSLELTPEEMKDNWKSFKEIGFKVHFPKEISDNEKNISARIIGDEEEDSELVYKGYVYRYVSDSVNEDAASIIDDSELNNSEKREKINKEILPRVKNVFALVTLRSKLITEKNKINDMFDTDDIVEVRKDDEFTQVIVFYKGDDSENLSKEEVIQYKEFIRASKKIVEGVVALPPIAKKDSLRAIKALKFDTLDLQGNQVTDAILQKADVTMVNIWATWCPPCRAELPDIGNLERKYRQKGCQVIAICSDVTDEDSDVLEEAKNIIKDAGCDFVVLQNNESFAVIYDNIQGYPTTLFFDKNGNVIGDVMIGSRSEQEFAKAIDQILEQIKK